MLTKKGRSLLVVLIAVLIAAAAVAAVSLLSGKGAPDESKQSKAPSQTTSQSGGSSAKTTTQPLTGIDRINVYKTITVPEKNWSSTLVNLQHRLPMDYEPPQLTTLKGGVEGKNQMDSRAAPYYTKMYQAAYADGVVLTPISAYRSVARQKVLFDNQVRKSEAKGYQGNEAVLHAATISMPAGASEHSLGFSSDICSLEESFANTKEYRWLSQHGAEYGFILRYPKDKQEITGVTFEPWHWRYVGAEAAKEMKEKNLCLEEYVGG